jgi:hypothetical protein
VEKDEEDKAGGSDGATNLAQRIEQKLWKYSKSGNVAKRWLLELISWILSAACMAGIVIMLMVLQDKRIPTWPLGLTLNAYISVLSKTASAALLLPVSEALGQLKWSRFQGDSSQKVWDFELFDNASRGPWGSFLLLIRTKGKSLAALGAAVTLFALCLDPFFQQVVQYPERWRLQEELGSIPRAIGYAPYLAGQEFRAGQLNDQLDQNMVSVTHRFFYDNGTVPVAFGKGVRAEIPVACPNSNCTWPEYETLGICNQCEEASDNLEFKCLNTTLDWVQVPDTDPETLENVYPNGTSCGWWLKGDTPILMSGYNVDNDSAHSGEILLQRAQPIYDLFTRDALPGYPSKVNNSRNPLLHGIIVSGGNASNVQRNMKPIAHECLVTWCAKRLLSTYSEGEYKEVVTDVFINHTVVPSLWTTFPTFTDGVQSGTYYIYGENITVKGDEGVYHLDNYTHSTTLSLFDDIFPSQFTLANSTNRRDALMRDQQYKTINPVTRNVTYNPFMFDNITTQFDNLAIAMTNQLRSSAKLVDMVTGPSYEEESYVEVRWPWLALPLGLLGLTFIFLIGTIIRSSLEREHVRILKNSAIATLIYGFPDDVQKKITESKEHGTPRAQAKELKVKWIPTTGWRFSSNTAMARSPKSPISPEIQIVEPKRLSDPSSTRSSTPPRGFF